MMINAYRKRLQEISITKDVNEFINVYMESCENEVDVKKEASIVLIELGEKAVEEVSRMLCNSAIDVNIRGDLANLLMVTTERQPEIGRNESIKSSLIDSLSDEDYFVAFNAAEALINMGVDKISDTPTREYVRNVRDQVLQKDFNALLDNLNLR